MEHSVYTALVNLAKNNDRFVGDVVFAFLKFPKVESSLKNLKKKEKKRKSRCQR